MYKLRLSARTLLLVSLCVAISLSMSGAFIMSVSGKSLSVADRMRPSKIPDTDPIGGEPTVTVPLKDISLEPLPVRPILCQDGFFGCTLIERILAVSSFLSTRENDEGYTPDPRPLTPTSEVIRLNVIPQAQGFMNLYTLTNKEEYKERARSRLDYVVGLGQGALARSPWDGNVGYVMLDAYQRIGGDSYRTFGLSIADECLTFTGQNGWGTDLILNWGYMCGMNFAKAYAVTGDAKYLAAVRTVTRRNAARQNADGGFPHKPQGLTDTLYTTWMMAEVLDIRKDDPLNPDVDQTLMKAEQVLFNRVNVDGSLNYADASGSYANNPGSYDTRGWTTTLSGLAYYLKAMGHDTEAQKLLTYLFMLERSDVNAGGYPDKYDYVELGDWSTGDPSVLRTSMLFGDLTAIALLARNSGSCVPGTSSSCVITPTNCSPAFTEVGLCRRNIAGVDRCIDGRQTKCINPVLITYPLTDCGTRMCTPGPGNCWHLCTPQGSQQCVAGICGACFEEYANMTDCVDLCGDDIIIDECF